MRDYADRVNSRKLDMPTNAEQDARAARITSRNPVLSEQDIAARDQQLEAIRCDDAF